VDPDFFPCAFTEQISLSQGEDNNRKLEFVDLEEKTPRKGKDKASP